MDKQKDFQDKLAALDSDFLDGAINPYKDELSYLRMIKEENSGRINNPLGSIHLLQSILKIDILHPHDLPIHEFFICIYVLNNGSKSLKYILKAHEKLKLLHESELQLSVDSILDEFAEAKADLQLEAENYYSENFSEDDFNQLSLEMVRCLQDVWDEFSLIKVKPKTGKDNFKSFNIKNAIDAWSYDFCRYVADDLGKDPMEVLFHWPGDKVGAIIGKMLIDMNKADRVDPEGENEIQQRLIDYMEGGQDGSSG